MSEMEELQGNSLICSSKNNVKLAHVIERLRESREIRSNLWIEIIASTLSFSPQAESRCARRCARSASGATGVRARSLAAPTERRDELYENRSSRNTDAQ